MEIDSTRMYRVSAVARLLDVSPSTVYRAIESGALPAVRIGSAVRVHGSALTAWLDQCGQSSYQAHVVADEQAFAVAGGPAAVAAQDDSTPADTVTTGGGGVRHGWSA